MRSSAPARHSVPPRGWRWLLVLLTLVASLMHLTRSPAVGGLGLAWALGLTQPGAQVQASQPVATQPQRVADVSAMSDAMPMDGPVDAAMRTRAAPPEPAHAPDLTHSAPNAPPHATADLGNHAASHTGNHSGDHAAAHCPFCFSAGFALESAPPFLASLIPTNLRPEAVRPRGPALSFVRHTDPRAPPRLG